MADPDGAVSSVTWRWAKSATKAGSYADIPEAAGAAYAPVAGDAGAWLRATARYADGHGSGKSAAGVAAETVGGGPPGEVPRGGGPPGDDPLGGDTGTDQLQGSEGEDTFVIQAGQTLTTIYDFTDGDDLIDLSNISGITGFSDLTITADGDDAVIDLSSQGAGSVRLKNVDVADLDADDFVFADDGM